VYWARIEIKANRMGAEISIMPGIPGGKGAGSSPNGAKIA